ncbi:hypothetical protein ABT247_21110 [Kitasatospora sp. NPDC001539]|uniref:hypothetical protein n=1 Tax=Kitasatospora sp. NPDC001539 TaxID=3154384 RepID=UPI0033308A3D
MQLISRAGAAHPWPEFMPDRRLVLVVPGSATRLPIAEDGWSDHGTATPAPAWSTVLADDNRLTIHRPGGHARFDGPITATANGVAPSAPTAPCC